MIMLGITGGADQQIKRLPFSRPLRPGISPAIPRKCGRLGFPTNLIPKAAHRMLFHLMLNFKIEASPRTLKDMWEEARSFSLVSRSGL